MYRVRPIGPLRRRRLRLRPLTRADLPALFWLQDAGRCHVAEALAPRAVVDRLIARAPAAQVAVELDHLIVGALLCTPSNWRPEGVKQPWDRLEGTGRPEGIEEAGTSLRGCGAIWREDLSAEEIDRVLTVGRKAVVQQLGMDGTFSVVQAADWGQWDDRMSAEAFLQQVHAGGLVDRAVSVFLDAGWLMRGFWESEGALEVVMWWENRAR